MFLVTIWLLVIVIAILIALSVSPSYDRVFNTVVAFVVAAIVAGIVILGFVGAILTDAKVGYTQESRVEKLSERGVYFDGEQYTFLVDDQVVSAYEADVTVVPDDRNEVLIKEYRDSDWTPWEAGDEYVLYIPAGQLITSEK